MNRRRALETEEIIDLNQVIPGLRDEVTDRPVYLERAVWDELWLIHGDEGIEEYLRETLPDILPKGRVTIDHYDRGTIQFQAEPHEDEEGAYYLIKLNS